MENQTTQAPAVNEEQKNVPVVANTKVSGTPEQVTPPVQNTDVNEFKTAEDEHKDGKLEPWMEERLARERRAKQREKERAEAERLRAEAAERELLMMRSTYGSTTPSPQSSQAQNDPVQVIKNLVRETFMETEKERSEKAAQEVQQRANIEFNSKLNRGIEKYDDFSEVVYQQDAPITPMMKAFLETIPNPDDFSYNSIKYNSDKLRDIAKLHPVMQAVQMSELYKGFSAKSGRKTVSNAPPPPNALNATNVGSKNQNEMSYEEIKLLLNKRRKKT